MLKQIVNIKLLYKSVGSVVVNMTHRITKQLKTAIPGNDNTSTVGGNYVNLTSFKCHLD